MNKARLDIAPGKLVINDGRIDWLPRNPRKWTAADIDKTVASIERDPDFMEDRPILVLPLEAGKYLVFCHNLLTTGAKRLKLKTVPCVVYFPETDEDRETVKRRAALDNGSFGSWDYDALANEWDDLPLVDLGIPAWEGETEESDEMPTDLDAEGRAKDFVLKVTFPDAGKMTAFVNAYKDVLEKDYGCIMSESGGAL